MITSRPFAAAPWPASLRLVSLVASVLLIATGYAMVAVVPPFSRPPLPRPLAGVIAILPIGIAVGCALFMVCGYEIEGYTLRVRRLFWTTVLPLTGLKRVFHDPKAMKGSIRLFGNGGLYSVTGIYRNRALGRYRAFVTDPARAVVVVLADRTIVVSPCEPERFVEALHTELVPENIVR